jgi:Flp pilus assembly pilin Flp
MPDAERLRERQAALWGRMGDLCRRGRRNEEGVSAVEFALIAPMLFFALLATADIGLALHERMTIDSVLRSGAQPAMQDRTRLIVCATLEETARNSFPVAPCDAEPEAGQIAVDARRFCACWSAPAVELACGATCPAPTTLPSAYWRLSAEKTYDGLFLPFTFFGWSLGEIEYAPAILVQIR